LKALREAEWRNQWKLKFTGEPGLDYGGVSREFFQNLGRALFSPVTGLFVSFDAAGQGLVHPNPRLPPGWVTNLFRFLLPLATRTEEGSL
jgi:hypothetical protein